MNDDPEVPRRAPASGAQNASAAIAPGCILKDRYVVEKELGRGGISVVYLARDRQLLSKPVVVKVLQEQTAPDPWFQKKFRQEIEALARIDHPGVVGVLDVGETPEGKPFLVMQFVEGVTLRSAIGKRGMDLRRVAGIMRKVGQALNAAHEKGVYHRDLKPENIMLQTPGDGEEYAKLIDFGIAAIRDSQMASSALSSKIAGSFAYMAPEQLMGNPCPASDIYSLGVIAYEMLAGQRPEMLPSGVKTKPREVRPEIPEAAEAVILSALSFHPEQRPPKPREFGEQLAAALMEAAPAVERTVGTQPSAARSSVASTTPSLEMAHVLFMDLVAYSAMPMDRQTQVIQQLQDLVRSSEEFQRAQASGQVVSLPTGDGMALVFFQNPVSAVQCAVEMARALRDYPSIKLRMGVHTGPVYRIADINTNRNVSGGGINLAQRVMDCGEAGHILVSKAVGEVLAQLSDWAPHLHDLGECEVKHGVKVHLLNLYTSEAGNPETPPKLRRGEVAPAPPPPVVRSHRGRYMLAGSALTLAILVFSAVQIANWRKTRAGSQAPQPPPVTRPAAPEPAPVSPPPAVSEPAPSRHPETRETRAAPRKTAAPREASPPPATPVSPSPTAEPPRAVQPPAPPPPDPAVEARRAALEQLRERLMLLAARAAAVRSSLQNLERQQARSGLGLRSDMAAAGHRMDYLFGEANAALKAGEADLLKRNLDLAERDLETLERFLGR